MAGVLEAMDLLARSQGEHEVLPVSLVWPPSREEPDAVDDLSLPAVAIEGAKGVGKTSTALCRAATVHRLGDPAAWGIAVADPRRLLVRPAPVLIDEWQRLPESWDLVCRAVDEQPSRAGAFLLTGSAAPLPAPTRRTT